MKSFRITRLASSTRRATIIAFLAVIAPGAIQAQTALGELEGRPAPVALRKCVGGANGGNVCNENADCPGSTCVDRNVFNISVAIHFNATGAELTTIQNMITAGSARLFDVTDGQVEIGLATLHNNAFGSTEADVRIYPAATPTWWQANTGSWKTGGSMHVSIDNIQAAGAVGESFAHEFLHLAFDPRDEYESRAAGCGGVTGADSCPEAATITAGETSCIMDSGGLGNPDGEFSELCWGQGDATDLTDVTGGNHDAGNTTEQSRCRSNRSCWDQVVWSWPSSILEPVGAPDPAANGLVVHPTQFLVIDDATRAVLVLDESGSMVLETPSRMERLKVAATDYIALAETGSELGIVSFASDALVASGRTNVPIAALGAARAAWSGPVNGLAPSTRTNISAGLDAARDLITAAGGVTGNTFIVLMTDGLNNEPSPQANADAELQATINDLQADGIEVYVTCTGSDLGLQSQCSEIATGTGGFYVDSTDAAKLPESFVEIGSLATGYELIAARGSARTAGRLKKTLLDVKRTATTLKLVDTIASALPVTVPGTLAYYVEKGSESALFTLQWQNPQTHVRATVVSPSGQRFNMSVMPQGLFRRVDTPETGDWKIEILGGTPDGEFVAKAYSRNRSVNVAGGNRFASVRPGGEIYVYAYPRSFGYALTHPGDPVPVLVTRPDGSTDVIVMHDRGREKNGRGDDVAGDGIFTGVYRNTQLDGAYQFASIWSVEDWPVAPDTRPHEHDPSRPAPDFRSPRFMRELRVTATVHDPSDVERTPDDPPAKGDGPCADPCVDKVAGWWTGGDPQMRKAAPVTITVQNAGDSDLFFETSPASRDLRFSLLAGSGADAKKLEIPENQYCEPRCPQAGPVREIDCRKPVPSVVRVPRGANTRVSWSGVEAVGIHRSCAPGERKFCREERVTKPGTYTVEVCAFRNVSGGAAGASAGRIDRATGVGAADCQRVPFVYPAQGPVVVRFPRR